MCVTAITSHLSIRHGFGQLTNYHKSQCTYTYVSAEQMTWQRRRQRQQQRIRLLLSKRKIIAAHQTNKTLCVIIVIICAFRTHILFLPLSTLLSQCSANIFAEDPLALIKSNYFWNDLTIRNDSMAFVERIKKNKHIYWQCKFRDSRIRKRYEVLAHGKMLVSISFFWITIELFQTERPKKKTHWKYDFEFIYLVLFWISKHFKSFYSHSICGLNIVVMSSENGDICCCFTCSTSDIQKACIFIIKKIDYEFHKVWTKTVHEFFLSFYVANLRIQFNKKKNK